MAASVLPAAVIRQIQHNVLYRAVLALDLVICIDDQVDGVPGSVAVDAGIVIVTALHRKKASKVMQAVSSTSS